MLIFANQQIQRLLTNIEQLNIKGKVFQTSYDTYVYQLITNIFPNQDQKLYQIYLKNTKTDKKHLIDQFTLEFKPYENRIDTYIRTISLSLQDPQCDTSCYFDQICVNDRCEKLDKEWSALNYPLGYSPGQSNTGTLGQ